MELEPVKRPGHGNDINKLVIHSALNELDHFSSWSNYILKLVLSTGALLCLRTIKLSMEASRCK